MVGNRRARELMYVLALQGRHDVDSFEIQRDSWAMLFPYLSDALKLRDTMLHLKCTKTDRDGNTNAFSSGDGLSIYRIEGTITRISGPQYASQEPKETESGPVDTGS